MKDYTKNMTAPIYYQSDCNLDLLKGKKIAIIGYGRRGPSHPLHPHVMHTLSTSRIQVAM